LEPTSFLQIRPITDKGQPNFLHLRAFGDKGPIIFTDKAFFTDKGLTIVYIVIVYRGLDQGGYVLGVSSGLATDRGF